MKLLKNRQTFKFNVVENNLNWKLHPIKPEKYEHQLPFESGLFGQIQFTEIISMNSGGLVMAILPNCHKLVKFPHLCEERALWVGFLTICILVNWTKDDEHLILFFSFVSLHWHTVLVWVERFPPFYVKPAQNEGIQLKLNTVAFNTTFFISDYCLCTAACVIIIRVVRHSLCLSPYVSCWRFGSIDYPMLLYTRNI